MLIYGSSFYYQKDNVLHIVILFLLTYFEAMTKIFTILKIVLKVNIMEKSSGINLCIFWINLYVKFIRQRFFSFYCQSQHNIISKINSKYAQSNSKAFKWNIKFQLWFSGTRREGYMTCKQTSETIFFKPHAPKYHFLSKFPQLLPPSLLSQWSVCLCSPLPTPNHPCPHLCLYSTSF